MHLQMWFIGGGLERSDGRAEREYLGSWHWIVPHLPAYLPTPEPPICLPLTYVISERRI